MSASLERLVSDLESHLDYLRHASQANGLAHDVLEAVEHWIYLGRRALERDTLVNFPSCAANELRSLAQLQQAVNRVYPSKQQAYASLFATSAVLLENLKSVLPSDIGHLGVVRAIRREFTYLETDYGLIATNDLPIGARYSSGSVYVHLEYARKPWMSCRFGPEPEGEHFFAIDDLLFLYGDLRYKSLPEDLFLDSERDVDEWFRFLAGIFRKYGTEFLTDAPGIIERLGKAQSQRDAEYAREMDRLKRPSPNGGLSAGRR